MSGPGLGAWRKSGVGGREDCAGPPFPAGQWGWAGGELSLARLPASGNKGSCDECQGEHGVGAGDKCGMLHWLEFFPLETIVLSFWAVNVEMFSRDWEGFRVILPGDRGSLW